MARLAFAVQAESLPDLVDAINLAMLPFTSHIIKGVVLMAVHKERKTSNYRMMIDLDTGGVLMAAPYQFVAFNGSSAGDATAQFTAYATAHPALFISPAEIVYIPADGGNWIKDSPLGAFTCTDAANAFTNWQTSGGASGGPAGGDLGGSYPNPLVTGFQGHPISAANPGSGATWIYNGTTWVPGNPVRYFANHAAAVAAATISPFIIDTFVVLNPGAPITEAGTYQIGGAGGINWPADYTLVSAATVTASQVGITDAGGYYPGAGNVEAALQQIGAGAAGQLGGVLVNGLNTLITEGASVTDAVWELELVKGTNSLSCLIRANVNAGNPSHTIADMVVNGAGPFDLTFGVVFTTGMALQVTTTSVGWSAKFRQRTLI